MGRRTWLLWNSALGRSGVVFAVFPPHCNVSIMAMFVRARVASPAEDFRRFIILAAVILAAIALAAPTARAQPTVQNTPNPAPACALEALGNGSVRRVIDGRTFQLDGGPQVRLAAIETPPLPLPGETGPHVRIGLAAKAALEALLAGRDVSLKKLGPDADRYGRMVAHVFVAEQERSVQQDLLAQGHARVAAEVGAPACAAALFAAERAARARGLGLWGDPYYVIQQAENPAKVLAERGRFTLVEGKVLSVRESGGTLYVNFGRRWSEDFTVTIRKRDERAFAAAGLEPKKLAGRKIRVRGFIEERGGPWIEASRPEQIEFAE
jgi:endonuclease YncB( thermonuclease family)